MAYEFKKLSDVNAIEAVSANTNVLVEENGEIVKVAANSLVPEDVVTQGELEAAIENIPETYLPTTVPVIQSAQVGQTIAVKAVDENGRPTEWEAVDVGGSSEYERIDAQPTQEQTIEYAKALKKIEWIATTNIGESFETVIGKYPKRIDVNTIRVDGYQMSFDMCGDAVEAIQLTLMHGLDEGYSYSINETDAQAIADAWAALYGNE